MRKLASILMAACMCVAVTGNAYAADNYPSKPIKLVVPYGAGSATDAVARLLAKHLETELSTSVAVVNVTGAAGTIGSTQVLKAKPDGYTLLWNHVSLFTAYHTGAAKFTWDSLTPICQGVRFYKTLAVRGDAPWKNLKEFIEDAKKNPGKINWGVNLGAGLHFEALGFETMTGTKFHYVAGEGESQQVTALLGGRIDVCTPSPQMVVQYKDDGRIRALAASTEERLPLLPEVPTYKEEGLDWTFMYELVLYGPANLPEAIVDRLDKAMAKIVKDPTFVEGAAKLGMDPAYLNHKDTIDHILRVDADMYMFARKGGLIPQAKI